MKYYPALKNDFPIKRMAKYLENVLRISEQNSSDGNVSKEFIHVLNRSVFIIILMKMRIQYISRTIAICRIAIVSFCQLLQMKCFTKSF